MTTCEHSITLDGKSVDRHVVVVGAGAAGTMAAIFAATAGAETTLLERTADGGRKILISGGGRCNVLPARVDESRFVTDSSRNTLRKIVRSWPLAEQRAFFESELGLELVEEAETAKLFPVSNRARDVRDGDGPLECDAVIVATGGLSVPQTGSDGAGLAILARLGHTMHRTYPALTPVTAEPAPFAELSGVSLTVTITARGAERDATATGGFLFTHRGYSGPSVLDVSHVVVRSADEGAEPPARMFVRWTALGDSEWERALRASGTRTVAGALRAEMPDRLASALIAAGRDGVDEPQDPGFASHPEICMPAGPPRSAPVRTGQTQIGLQLTMPATIGASGPELPGGETHTRCVVC